MRLSKRISKEDFLHLLKTKIFSDDDFYFHGYFEKDLKIEFDTENNSIFDLKINDIKIENDLTYALCSAGGDWEYPVSYILYIDNKNKFRIYIPTNGNVFHKKLKKAFGNDEIEDVREYLRILPDKEMKKEFQSYLKFGSDYHILPEPDYENLYNEAEMMKETFGRIKVSEKT